MHACKYWRCKHAAIARGMNVKMLSQTVQQLQLLFSVTYALLCILRVINLACERKALFLRESTLAAGVIWLRLRKINETVFHLFPGNDWLWSISDTLGGRALSEYVPLYAAHCFVKQK